MLMQNRRTINWIAEFMSFLNGKRQKSLIVCSSWSRISPLYGCQGLTVEIYELHFSYTNSCQTCFLKKLFKLKKRKNPPLLLSQLLFFNLSAFSLNKEELPASCYELLVLKRRPPSQWRTVTIFGFTFSTD